MSQSLVAGNDHLETLTRCGGYYSCLKSRLDGKRLGPLVGYAGKYTAPDGTKKQYVGDIYANFAKAEEHLEALYYFAQQTAYKLSSNIVVKNSILCAMPIGGYSFSQMLGMALERPVIKAEKKVIALATETSREQSKLVFGRHSIEKGAPYLIGEDVCNNFSTTDEGIELIHSLGGIVVGIVCFLNRSPTVDSVYRSSKIPVAIPVISLVRQVIEEYQQDDPAVVEDVAKGNVIWKPKDEWHTLTHAMNMAKPT